MNIAPKEMMNNVNDALMNVSMKIGVHIVPFPRIGGTMEKINKHRTKPKYGMMLDLLFLAQVSALFGKDKYSSASLFLVFFIYALLSKSCIR